MNDSFVSSRDDDSWRNEGEFNAADASSRKTVSISRIPPLISTRRQRDGKTRSASAHLMAAQKGAK